MSRAWLPWVAVLGAAACGECACESGEAVHEAHGRRVTIVATHHRGVGIDGIGAPHAIGIIWPTLEDEGIRITMRVDDRDPVGIGSKRTGDEDEIAARVAVTVSADGHHVAVRTSSDEPWRVFHLLPRGVPFDSPASDVPGDEVDFSGFATPERIAIDLLGDEEHDHGEQHALLWRALEVQDPSDALDTAVLARWPGSERARAVVAARLEDGGASDAWRAALADAAREVISHDLSEPASFAETAARYREVREAMTVITTLGDAHLSWLDERMVSEWESSDATSAALRHWLEHRHESTGALEGAPPLSDELRRRAARRARVQIEQIHAAVAGGAPDEATEGERTLAEWVVYGGTDADRAWLHDLMLSRWPPSGTSRRAHFMTVAIAEGALGTPSEEWRRRATSAAVDALPTERCGDGTELLLALDAPPSTIDRAFDALLRRGDHLYLIERNGARATTTWKRRAVAWCQTLPERIDARDIDESRRHRERRSVCFDLAVELEDCNAARQLAADHQVRDLSAACAER